MSVITLGAVPTLASFTGTVGNEALLNSINADLGNSNFFNSFEDILSKGREMFVKYAVQPVISIGNTLRNMVGMMNSDEQYIPVTDQDRLAKVPICMHNAILMHPPIAKLFEEGRIFGFGYQHLPVYDDCYNRQLANGYVPDVLEAMDDQGDFELNYEFRSTDTELTFDELEALEETITYIDYILNETDIDPTDPLLNSRG